MTIPVESSEVVEFTPDNLLNIENPPVFRLRTPDDRHLRRYNLMCGEARLKLNSDDAFDKERVKAIPFIWPDTSQEYLDRFNTIREAVKQKIEISPADAIWIDEICEQIADNWPPIARMEAKNSEWWEYAPLYLVSTIVLGWKGLKAEHKLEAGYLSLKSVRKMAVELAEIEKEAIKNKVEGVGMDGLGFLSLWGKCQSQTRLDEDEEKNSPAPSPATSPPQPLTTNLPADGASTEANGEDSNASTSSAQSPTPKSAGKGSNSETPATE